MSTQRPRTSTGHRPRTPSAIAAAGELNTKKLSLLRLQGVTAAVGQKEPTVAKRRGAPSGVVRGGGRPTTAGGGAGGGSGGGGGGKRAVRAAVAAEGTSAAL